LALISEAAGLSLHICLHPLAHAQFQHDGREAELAMLQPYLATGSTQDVLLDCAHLITDYSATAFEAALAGRSVWFYPYDVVCYEHNRGLNIDTSAEFPEATFLDPRQLVAAITQANAAPDPVLAAAQERFFARYLSVQEQSATARIADLVCARLQES
jgi:CDP-glycerol glycerophosphotransferase (TagB/SpsB family)